MERVTSRDNPATGCHGMQLAGRSLGRCTASWRTRGRPRREPRTDHHAERSNALTHRRVLRLGRRVTPPRFVLDRPIEGVMTPTLHLYCGIDSATAHHDVAVIDDDGRVVVRGRVGNDAAGFAQSERCVIIFGLVWGS
jgi:hypothetical protein